MGNAQCLLYKLNAISLFVWSNDKMFTAFSTVPFAAACVGGIFQNEPSEAKAITTVPFAVRVVFEKMR